MPYWLATASLNFTTRGAPETPVPRSSAVMVVSHGSRFDLRRIQGMVSSDSEFREEDMRAVVKGCGTVPMV